MIAAFLIALAVLLVGLFLTNKVFADKMSVRLRKVVNACIVLAAVVWVIVSLSFLQ